MAKNKKPGGPDVPSVQGTVPENVPVKVQVVQGDSTPTYYSNFVEVSHTEYEFALSFVKLPTKLRPQQLADVKSGQSLLLEPFLQVEVPSRLVRGIIKALETQVEKYEQRHGKILDSGTGRG
jgi:hypothetical protein